MIEVTFTAANSGMHGSPRVILKRTYDNPSQIALLPLVGEVILIQYGEIQSQSGSFKVEKIDKSFWAENDTINFWVKSVE